MSSREKKQAYIDKICALCERFSKFLLINANNVGARQMSTIREAFRGRAEIVMGKNSLIRRAFSVVSATHPEFSCVSDAIAGNVGLVFTNADIRSTITEIESFKVDAEAKQGAFAPCDVVVQKGNTGLEPTKTTFFQNLEIATKITRGTVDVITKKLIVEKGERVNAAEAFLLQLLKVKPFQYGLRVVKVYESGSLYDVEVMNMTDFDKIKLFLGGIRNVAAASLELGYMNEASMPLVIGNAFRSMLHVAVGSNFEYSFPEAKEVQDFLSDPEKMAAMLAAQAAAAAAGAGGDADGADDDDDEEEEEEGKDEGMGAMMGGGGLFGDDDSEEEEESEESDW